MHLRIDGGDSSAIHKYCEGLTGAPGKLEGCERWAVFYYDCLLDGDGEEIEDGWVRFDVRASEVRLFPELRRIAYVDLYEDDNGFIHHDIILKYEVE
jgi:hypothetical protein